MPQALLPLIPDGSTVLNDRISVVKEDGKWTYFCGIVSVFRHDEDDLRSFRMFTAQLICQGQCRQVDVIRVFGVSSNSIRRSVATYEQEGVSGFFQPRKTRGPTVLTPEVVANAQVLLSQGRTRRQVADTSSCLHHLSQVSPRGLA